MTVTDSPRARARGEPPASLRRLATLAGTVNRHRQLCERLARKVEPLGSGGVVAVAGEAAILDRLRRKLGQAESLVEEIGRTATAPARAKSILDELDRLLGGAAWQLAAELDSELDGRLAEQEQVVEQVKGGLLRWRDRLRPVRRSLDDAVAVGAMVEREREAIARLDGLVAQLDRAIDTQRYDEAWLALFRLDHPDRPVASPTNTANEPADPRTPEQLGTDIQRRTAEMRALARRAELMLMRGPLGTRVEYTLLLRTPSARGAHGMNLQGSSTIVAQDQRRLEQIVEAVTRSVNDGRKARTLTLEAPPAAPAPDVTAALRKLGERTYRLLMPDVMHRLMTDLTCSLTITTNELSLPWELMHDDEEFLCAKRPIARMPMGWAFPRRARLAGPAGSGSKLRFLLVYADPHGNLPKAGQEVEKVAAALRARWQDQIDVVVKSGPEATGDALNEALGSGSWDVVHYAGHAAFDRRNPALSGLLLHEEEVFFAEKVQRLVEGQPLVFLNACETSMTADESDAQTTGYLAEPAEGLASSFVYGGALGCIGSLWPVYDDSAAQFAIEFYHEVLRGQLIGEALRRARVLIREQFPQDVTWASYVLYGDPAFQLAVPTADR